MRPPVRATLSLAAAAVLALLPGCGRSRPASSGPSGEADGGAPAGGGGALAPGHQEARTPFGFVVWHADFPLEVHVPPAVSGRYYDFGRTRALERLVAKLQGNCTREGWLFAKDFFNRAPEEAVPLLVAALDRAFQARERADIVENTAAAMGRMKRHRGPALSEALLRAVEHPKQSVRETAMRALISAGTAEAVREARRLFDVMSVRGKVAWIRAAAARLPGEVEAVFGELLGDERYPRLAPVIVDQCAKMEPRKAARIVGPFWREVRHELRPSIAAILHAAGDRRGTRYLQEVMRDADARNKVLALGGIARGDLEPVLDDVLALSIHESSGVRSAVAAVIAEVPGENIDNVLATLAMDPVAEVRQVALRALRERGERALLDALIERVRTASGTKLRQAIADLSAAGDGQAIPAMVERFEKAPAGESRMFLQAIGRSRAAEAFAPMKDIFLGPERSLGGDGRWTTVTYTAELLPNLVDSRHDVVDLFQEVPRRDYRRRAVLMRAMGNAAAVSEDAELKKRTYDAYRAVALDSEEIPQMRLLALQYLRKDMTLDDMTALKRAQHREEGPIRKALTSFLFEFF